MTTLNRAVLLESDFDFDDGVIKQDVCVCVCVCVRDLADQIYGVWCMVLAWMII